MPIPSVSFFTGVGTNLIVLTGAGSPKTSDTEWVCLLLFYVILLWFILVVCVCQCVPFCCLVILHLMTVSICYWGMLGWTSIWNYYGYLEHNCTHLIRNMCFSFLETCTYRYPLEEMCDFVQSCHTAFGNEMYIVAFSSVGNALLILSSTSLILHFVLPAFDARPP